MAADGGGGWRYQQPRGCASAQDPFPGSSATEEPFRHCGMDGGWGGDALDSLADERMLRAPFAFLHLGEAFRHGGIDKECGDGALDGLVACAHLQTILSSGEVNAED